MPPDRHPKETDRRLKQMDCPICFLHASRKVIRKHLRGDCPLLSSLASGPNVQELYKVSPRRSKAEARFRCKHPSTPPPNIPRRASQLPPPPQSPPDPSTEPYRPDDIKPDLWEGTSIRHVDFVLDTPGAGPSGHRTPLYIPRLVPPRPHDPLIYDEEEADLDNVPPGPTLAEGPPWLEGLSTRDILEQELEAEIARCGGRKLPETDFLAVRGFNYKVKNDITVRAYNRLPRAFHEIKTLPNASITKSRMAVLAGVRGVLIDCCIDSCVAFTGDYAARRECPHCGKDRFNTKGTARKYFRYIPLIPRLVNLFRDPKTVHTMLYRSQRRPRPGVLSDIFDGEHYRRLCGQRVSVADTLLPHNFFSNPNDIALGLSTDGFGPFKTHRKTCWPLLLFNYNLPPQIRFRLENMLCLGVIPGPSQPKEIGTFLDPFIQEMEDLARGVPAYDSYYSRPFHLHAYLLTCFGDMPAVAKLMCMKGHNGKSPCRACRIRGIRNPNPRPGASNHTNYVPLHRPFSEADQGPRQYDPLNLPLRTHDEFIVQAKQVDRAPTNAKKQRRARLFGINSLSPLSRLSSLEFPTCFPHDFMHALFENVIPTLINLWTHSGKMKNFGSGKEDYVLEPDVWSAIGAACAASGNTIPAAFGCRVPNLADEHYHRTAESTTLFTTLLAPALLRGKFRRRAYYTHFIELVRLISVCTDLEIRQGDVNMVREGFAKWVEQFEKLYYAHRPNRLRACTLPIHSLLHIADDILAMGPVWCYWAFPMERFCGGLARTPKSPRSPFSSLDRRVLEVAQLSQIRLMYGLGDQLDLDDHGETLGTGTQYNNYPSSLFLRPRTQETLPISLHRLLAKYLSPIVGVGAKAIENRLPTHQFVQWGRMRIVTDKGPGDLFRGNEMVTTDDDMTRDASHAKYFTDINRCDVRKPTKLDRVTEGYGQIQRFIVIDANFLQKITDDAAIPIIDPIIVSVIRPIPLFSLLHDSNLIMYRLPGGKLANPEIVGVDEIVCLVGRVEAPDGAWYIADRNSIIGRVDLVDELLDPD